MPQTDDVDGSLISDKNTSVISTDSQPITNRASNDSFIFDFKSKGLHVCNLNIRHILPKIDEIRLILLSTGSPDIFGICESFLGTQHPDSLITVDGYSFFRKDRSETQQKSGGGLVLYFRQSLNVKRRYDLENSNIETLWVQICLSNCKPFLLCTVYRPPNACSDWIDLFENELSIAQATGLEFLVMGDFNIDLQSCSNSKWLNLIQLFDLTQFVKEPTRVTESSSTIIDHAYSSDSANITECFVPSYAISDHFPICFTRKVNSKISKTVHTMSSYRYFKTFDETIFLNDLRHDLSKFQNNCETIDDNFSELHAIIIKLLDKQAPIKTRRVKSNRLPAWYTPEIGQTRIARDKCKRLKQWAEYKRLQLNKANVSDAEASFLDLHLSISDGFVKTKIYDKRDDFDFDIVNFPFLDGDVPRSASYGVYISQLIRFARVSSHVDDFNTRNKVLTAKLLRQGYRYHKLRKAFSKFYRRHFDIVSKYNVGLKTLLLQGFSEPEFYGDLVYKFRKIIGKIDFPYHFKKIIVRYKKIGYNINVMRQTACLVVNPIKVNSFAYLFNCTTVGRTSD